MEELRKKLQVKDHRRFLLIDVPDQLAVLNKEFPQEGKWKLDKSYDLIIIFAHSRAQGEESLGEYLSSLEEDQLLWFCYPKKSSANYQSDLDREKCAELLAEYGYKPVRQVSLDEDWSALRFRESRFVRNS